MPENTETSATNSNEAASARTRLRDQLKMLGTAATMAANQGFVKTARLARPLLRGYTGCDDDDQHDDLSTVPEKLPPDRLTDREQTLLMNAGAKLAFETIELATLAYPPTEGIEPYRAVKDDKGCYPAPHLAHVVSLGRAMQDLFGDKLLPNKAPGDAPLPDGVAARPVLLTALNGDEYGYLTSPIRPQTIRRVALGQRDNTLNRDT